MKPYRLLHGALLASALVSAPWAGFGCGSSKPIDATATGAGGGSAGSGGRGGIGGLGDPQADGGARQTGGGGGVGAAEAGAGGVAGTGAAGAGSTAGSGAAGAGGTGGSGGSKQTGSGGIAGASSSGGGGAGGASLDCDPVTIPADHPATSTYELGTDTVTNRTTGLMWQRKPDSVTLLSFSRCSHDTLGGFSGWRLPTALELITVVDFSAQAPAINAVLFPATPSAWFATSTPVWPSTALNFWTVDFSTGRTVNGSTTDGYVRCVRPTSPPVCFAQPRFWMNEKDSNASGVATIIDRKTGLAWQRSIASDPLSWDDALRYCTSLAAGGRLPTAKELLSIVDWQASAAIDLGTFPDTPLGDYWTATAVAGSSTDALTVAFGNPTYTGLHTAPKAELHVVRCSLGRY